MRVMLAKLKLPIGMADNEIIKKVKEITNELEKIEFNNKTIIRCLNTQIASLVRYYIGSIYFTIGCLK